MSVDRFEANAEYYLKELEQELRNGSYKLNGRKGHFAALGVSILKVGFLVSCHSKILG